MLVGNYKFPSLKSYALDVSGLLKKKKQVLEILTQNAHNWQRTGASYRLEHKNENINIPICI